MIKIAILDDSDNDRSRMEHITREYFLGSDKAYEVTMFSDSDTLLEELRHKQYYDVFLLDMEMPQRTGLETAHEIRMIYMEPIIVYVTNHVEYAIEAYEVNAFRYIPKIMLEEKLPQAYDALLPRLDEIDQRTYSIETEDGVLKILYRNIYYIYKEKKRIVIVHRDGQCRQRKLLQEIYEELHSEEYIYIYKGCIVNMLHILSREKEGLRMRDGAVLAVSRPRQREVREKLFSYWGKQKA